MLLGEKRHEMARVQKTRESRFLARLEMGINAKKCWENEEKALYSSYVLPLCIEPV